MLHPACYVLLDSKLVSVLLTQSAALCFSVHRVLVVAAGSVISLRCGALQSIRYFAMGDFVRNGCTDSAMSLLSSLLCVVSGQGDWL